MLKIVDYLIDTGFTDISFVNVGSQTCSPGHKYGPLAQDKHLVHIILSGRGKVVIDGKEYFLEKGNYFYFKPGEVTYYEADKEDPWTYFWFGFNLNEEFYYVSEMIEEVGRVKQISIFEEKSLELMDIDYADPSKNIMIQGKLLLLMFSFIESIDIGKKTTHPPCNDKNNPLYYSNLFCRVVRMNYWKKDLTIEKIANQIGLNPTYFSSIIKEELQKTPLEYLTNYRLEKAERYITYTNQSVSEIAYLVGYKNTNNFSRSFKKRYGLSPSSYRKEIQKKLEQMEVKK